MLTFLVAHAFAAASPPAVERRLYADRVDASSFLWNDWNKFQENYHPNYVMDDDPTTAWVEGADDDGVGQWLRLPLTPMEGATTVRLRVRNGYQKSPTLFKANARVREVEVTLLPAGVTTTATLTDTEGWQELTFTQPPGKLDGVELKVKSTYAGAKYTDLCLSDVEVYVTATTRDNPAAEKAKLDRIVAWRANRVEAAKVFEASTSQHMPLAQAYSLEIQPDLDAPSEPVRCDTDPSCQVRPLLHALRSWPHPEVMPASLPQSLTLAQQAFATEFAGWTPVQAVPTDKRRAPPIEGLRPANIYNCYYEPALYIEDGAIFGAVELPVQAAIGFLRSSTVGTFAVSDGPSLADARTGNSKLCSSNEQRPSLDAWAKTTPSVAGAPATVQALFLVSCAQIEDREGMAHIAHSQLLVYDAAGNLELLVGPRYATAFRWRDTPTGPVIAEAWRVARWTSPVHAVEVQKVTKAP